MARKRSGKKGPRETFEQKLRRVMDKHEFIPLGSRADLASRRLSRKVF